MPRLLLTVLLAGLAPCALLSQDTLPLTPARRPAGSAALEVVAASASSRLDAPVLDLALLGEDTLVALSAASVSVYRVEAAALTLEARAPLPPAAPVRWAAGLLVAPETGKAVWALVDTAREAVLFARDGRRLQERQRAAAAPWPGAPDGVRFRPGTSQLQGAIAALGPGPFLALRPDAAVATDGSLLVAGRDGPRRTGVRAGSALAALWPGVLAVSSPAPPAASDAIEVYDLSGNESRSLARLEIEGSVRALAARVSGARARIAAATSGPRGPQIQILDVTRRRP